MFYILDVVLCLVFGLLCSMARNVSVTTCDACAMDHVVRNPKLPWFLHTACDQKLEAARPGNE